MSRENQTDMRRTGGYGLREGYVTAMPVFRDLLLARHGLERENGAWLWTPIRDVAGIISRAVTSLLILVADASNPFRTENRNQKGGDERPHVNRKRLE